MTIPQPPQNLAPGLPPTAALPQPAIAAGIPPAPATAPAPQPAVAPTVPQPATLPGAQVPAAMPAQPAPMQPAPVQAAPMPAVPAAAPGMTPMGTLRKLVSEATVSNQRKGLPDGTAIFVVNGVERKTARSSMDFDVFSLTCLMPISDANGLRYTDQGYAGVIPGNSYQYPIFINTQYSGHVRQWLNLVQCFQGWDEATLKSYQASEEGLNQLMPLIQYYIGFDFNTNQPTVSVLSNMNCAEVNTTTNRKQEKAADKKTLLYDATGQPVMKDYTNTYFNRHVPVAEVWQALGHDPEFVYRCFGGKENFERAYAQQNPQ